MYYTLEEHNTIPYIHCQPGWLITSEKDAINIVGFCAECETSRVLLQASNLLPEFYDLRTGLAGAILGKFSVYRLRVGFVISLEFLTTGRFGEMVLECNRRDEIHFSSRFDLLLDWLVKADPYL